MFIVQTEVKRGGCNVGGSPRNNGLVSEIDPAGYGCIHESFVDAEKSAGNELTRRKNAQRALIFELKAECLPAALPVKTTLVEDMKKEKKDA